MKKKKRLNNKGFSLVELIIVIAIMAILAGAMAPRLIKYIEKSRVSTDTSNCDAIKTAVQTVLSDEDAYEDAKAGSSFTFQGTKPVLPDGAFKDELNDTIKEWPKSKAKDTKGFKVSLDDEKNVTVGTY